jgi:hypothetical protein
MLSTNSFLLNLAASIASNCAATTSGGFQQIPPIQQQATFTSTSSSSMSPNNINNNVGGNGDQIGAIAKRIKLSNSPLNETASVVGGGSLAAATSSSLLVDASCHGGLSFGLNSNTNTNNNNFAGGDSRTSANHSNNDLSPAAFATDSPDPGLPAYR